MAETGRSTEPARHDPAWPETDRMWQELVADLTPAKSMARVDARARQLISAVSLVGALLTGFGLIAIGQLGGSQWAARLATVAVVAAVLAVVTALAMLVIRFPRNVTLGDIEDVQRWCRKQSFRAYEAALAGGLLAISMIAATAAGLVVLYYPQSHEPVVTTQIAGMDGDTRLLVQAEFTGAKAGTALNTLAVGETSGGRRVVLARGVTRIGRDGSAAAKLEATRVGGYRSIIVTVQTTQRKCVTTLYPTVADKASKLVCG